MRSFVATLCQTSEATIVVASTTSTTPLLCRSALCVEKSGNIVVPNPTRSVQPRRYLLTPRGHAIRLLVSLCAVAGTAGQPLMLPTCSLVVSCVLLIRREKSRGRRSGSGGGRSESTTGRSTHGGAAKGRAAAAAPMAVGVRRRERTAQESTLAIVHESFVILGPFFL